MNQFKFTKMHGLGNSYIYVNMFQENISEDMLSEVAIKVANMYTGIGSDGLILIAPSKLAPVKMRIFNNDGSEARNCGNGLRCVAKYAYENGLVNETTFFIETLSGLVSAEVHLNDNKTVSEVTVDMGKPALEPQSIPFLGSDAKSMIDEPVKFVETELRMTAVSMGNPHAVFFIDNIDDAPLYTLGPIIEKDARFPEGVNVEFIQVVNDTEINFRVWERGSGVTQACGTGACAAVVASVLNNKVKRDSAVVVHLEGGDLTITWTKDGHVMMTGPAETICTGTYYY
ncbi:diaminopimelate epimerase [Bacillus sp. HMF5848]|uniref:diaminopimelate epimerase n=1 Tax=Bacillus sp. HMF5848 TaxID=2495421 RepID=UPI000F7786B7|nr:diaminopimelate epimerase [Bacillus sp. HMF5848]RSK28428.1 diaminopimelate epimerase [Bacillus sp. HMF5848]